MNEVVRVMLQRYRTETAGDYENALKEIIQEIALLGLWRAKFFEHAAFYGGSALRILYGLNRFSEHLDFSLIRPNSSFSLRDYHRAVQEELVAFEFDAHITPIEKSAFTPVESAFIKAGTLVHLIHIGTPPLISKVVPRNKVMTIKFEIDTAPALGFTTESKVLLRPIPFNLTAYSLADLFAGKMHCILCRAWKSRVKGRDWYDLVWLAGQGIPLHLGYLRAKLVQSGVLAAMDPFDSAALHSLYAAKVKSVDFSIAKQDVLPFLKDPDSIKIWSEEFFLGLFEHLQFR